MDATPDATDATSAITRPWPAPSTPVVFASPGGNGAKASSLPLLPVMFVYFFNGHSRQRINSLLCMPPCLPVCNDLCAWPQYVWDKVYPANWPLSRNQRNYLPQGNDDK
jgi:hypothetical protein